MRYKFIGQYTNGHTSINACGVDFVGREPAEVATEDGIRRLSRHPEFEHVEDEPDPEVIASAREIIADQEACLPTPKRRGRKPKVAE